MNYTEHKTGGIVVSVITGIGAFIYTTDGMSSILCAVSAFIFALYPDMDINSTPRKIFTPIGIISAGLLFYFDKKLPAIVLLGLIVLPLMMRHRGFIHSILGMFLAALAWNYVVMYLVPTTELNGFIYAFGAICGYMTHLVLDTHFRIL